MEWMEGQWRACALSGKVLSRLGDIKQMKCKLPIQITFKIFQDSSSQERLELEALRQKALSSLVKVSNQKSSRPEGLGQRRSSDRQRSGREESLRGRNKGGEMERG